MKRLVIKKCSKCKKIKNLSEFCKDKYSNDGYRSECKECKKEYYKKYYKENKIRMFKQQKDRYRNFVKEWSSGAEACRYLNMDRSNISKCIRGFSKTAGGFRWRNSE